MHSHAAGHLWILAAFSLLNSSPQSTPGISGRWDSRASKAQKGKKKIYIYRCAQTICPRSINQRTLSARLWFGLPLTRLVKHFTVSGASVSWFDRHVNCGWMQLLQYRLTGFKSLRRFPAWKGIPNILSCQKKGWSDPTWMQQIHKDGSFRFLANCFCLSSYHSANS